MSDKNTKKIWNLTDDDSAQYLCYLDPVAGSTGQSFELWQVCRLVRDYCVANATISIADYTKEEILDVLRMYGYDDMDDFVNSTSPENIDAKPDGSLDRESPGYIVEWSLIAEMLFECEALQHLVPGKSWKDFEAAHMYIKSKLSNGDNAIQ